MVRHFGVSTHRPGLVVLVIDDSAPMASDVPELSPLASGWFDRPRFWNRFGGRENQQAGTPRPVVSPEARGAPGAGLPPQAPPRISGCLWAEAYAYLVFLELLARSAAALSDGTVEVRPHYFVYTILYGRTPTVWPAGASGGLTIEDAIRAYGNAGEKLGLRGALGPTADARAAFAHAHDFLADAVATPRFRDSYPPLLIHVTKGLPSQTDPEPIAQQIKHLASAHGNVRVASVMLDAPSALAFTDPSDFPGYLTEDEVGRSEYSRKLFRMSSIMPDATWEDLVARQVSPQIRLGVRLFFDVRSQDMLKYVLPPVDG